MEPKENLTLIDVPLNIFGLEVFDFVLIFLLPSPLLILSMFYLELLFIYLVSAVGTGIFLKVKKRNKGYGYIKRVYVRLVRKVLGQKKVVYA